MVQHLINFSKRLQKEVSDFGTSHRYTHTHTHTHTHTDRHIHTGRKNITHENTFQYQLMCQKECMHKFTYANICCVLLQYSALTVQQETILLQSLEVYGNMVL